MKFYKAGKRVKDIDDMKKGEMYSVCGVAGVFMPVLSKDKPLYSVADEAENVSLVIGRDALLDRIHFGMVYEIKKSFNPRAKTIAKLLS